MRLHPGKWSCYVIEDYGTWAQPTYRLHREMEEDEFCSRVLSASRTRAFLVLGIDEDESCPDEDVKELTVEPRS